MMERNRRHSRLVGGAFCRDAASVKGTPGENLPGGLPLRLDVVTGPERLSALEESQELQGKLRLLQADSTELDALFTELSARVVSIDSEDKVIFVTFQMFEQVWKFTTYYTHGLLGHCLENLLFHEKSWLEKDLAMEVSIDEDTLHLVYMCILMQEASLFTSCTANQMFDSSTSAGDLYLEQGDVALFEPPFLGSGWTVLCLADGARGTAPKPALEPVLPFHQWFLKSCAESILVGDGKPVCDFPLHFARGICVAAVQYDAEGPDELSLLPGDRVIIVGRLASCHLWFLGMKEATSEVGLVGTSNVKVSADTYESADVLLDTEEATLFRLQEDKVIEQSTALLKDKCCSDISRYYKLDVFTFQDSEKKQSRAPSATLEPVLRKIILTQEKDSSSECILERIQNDVNKADEVKLPFFVAAEEGHRNITMLVSFLDGQHCKDEFKVLYNLSPDLLSSSVFCAHEDELISFLAIARETARKKRLLWPQTRLCFLLAKLCAGRSKFSQARVYLEEALGVPCETFTDIRLLASIYSNLAGIYLLQKNTESFFGQAERLAALLMATPDCLECVEDSSVLKYILKKALLSHNKTVEARACYLLAMHHWTRAEGAKVVPYLERLLALCAGAQGMLNISTSGGYLILGRLYREMSLPNLSVSSARRASLHPGLTLTESLSSMLLVSKNVQQLCGTQEKNSFPAFMAPYLNQCLTLTGMQGACKQLKHQLAVCLSQLFYQHRMVGKAIQLMQALIDNPPPCLSDSLAEQKSALIWLAWLHIDNGQATVALRILDEVLTALPEHCTTPLEGLVLNMRGVALRCMGDLRRAAESYQGAVDICQEYEDMANWAVAQANIGLLCLKAGAKGLAQRHLMESVQLFSELDEGGHETTFIAVLLELGRHYVDQQQTHYGKGCYEWALLLAMHANLLQCQLNATRCLCHLYERERSEQAQCIIYNQYQVRLLQGTREREQEGETLEIVSQLYLSLATHRAYRAALDYTKSSLAIFIDLGFREKEAHGWLQAGKIYHLLGQNELVELYLQVAQDVALSTGDTKFILEVLEAAGDLFFNSSQERDKAVVYYRDRALPIAVKYGSLASRLRLCNKLSEVMLSLKLYGEAVEFAHTVLDISITLGDHLNERVGYHRLARLYQCLDQCELAEHYYLKTLSLCPAPLQFDEEALYYARVYHNLGDILFYHLKEPFDAAGYYHLALAAAMDVGNKQCQLTLCTRLATIYHNFLMDRELSLYFYKKARGLAAELNVRRINILADHKYVAAVDCSTHLTSSFNSGLST
uniref:SH3 domain and tetratricopeptide repeat-containing protein 1 n=1 Tax=Doryrhamphus excisus TaxID=161450 RepID=UPI0025ADFC4E|nr:SH3 domain and tetratricopeptide repeat-containing protein 1 [Doryrhamphus excisus]XP_057923852.1 SH3 domain and tetratricopeptide repeat-containing protein 1 [Doryrhamphus excisus]XP_057923853.1 SH3 domain and tetratricopeptide repeat-containing protein 1 [Doryrhamphus excisus]XP_057923854.1 SH3 domain and tetratricopeptide repeat-containing protein 1 [Doryrhamphus excisus]XP_057923855.1 SH3 domain and tetratricopeptide repeat-containing protein 1 [Doryrhamphus excisus]XP_057923856.1 SH3 d